jgi:hypothetical protein
MLTPEILAAQKAGSLVEATFYSDAKAATVLKTAIAGLVTEFELLQGKAMTGAVSVGPAISTIAVRNSSGNLVANQFVGIADNADRTFIDRTNARVDPTWNDSTTSTQYRTARLTATSYSIAARDVSGNITANIFNGTATAARYADLAEKYLADKDYVPGTVVIIGGSKEVTASDVNTRAIGVVSADPAFMMNKDLEGGIYIALKGRVPCKTYGSVQKGDRLISGPGGTAMAAHGNYANVFAIDVVVPEYVKSVTLVAKFEIC